jgi:hypothetical protein
MIWWTSAALAGPAVMSTLKSRFGSRVPCAAQHKRSAPVIARSESDEAIQRYGDCGPRAKRLSLHELVVAVPTAVPLREEARKAAPQPCTRRVIGKSRKLEFLGLAPSRRPRESAAADSVDRPKASAPPLARRSPTTSGHPGRRARRRLRGGGIDRLALSAGRHPRCRWRHHQNGDGDLSAGRVRHAGDRRPRGLLARTRLSRARIAAPARACRQRRA